MLRTRRMISRSQDTERGASLVESALIITLIGLVALVALVALGRRIGGNYVAIGTELDRSGGPGLPSGFPGIPLPTGIAPGTFNAETDGETHEATFTVTMPVDEAVDYFASAWGAAGYKITPHVGESGEVVLAVSGNGVTGSVTLGTDEDGTAVGIVLFG